LSYQPNQSLTFLLPQKCDKTLNNFATTFKRIASNFTSRAIFLADTVTLCSYVL
jgi:hypothetical protein